MRVVDYKSVLFDGLGMNGEHEVRIHMNRLVLVLRYKKLTPKPEGIYSCAAIAILGFLHLTQMQFIYKLVVEYDR